MVLAKAQVRVVVVSVGKSKEKSKSCRYCLVIAWSCSVIIETLDE